jgi:hypothetical protein
MPAGNVGILVWWLFLAGCLIGALLLAEGWL